MFNYCISFKQLVLPISCPVFTVFLEASLSSSAADRGNNGITNSDSAQSHIDPAVGETSTAANHRAPAQGHNAPRRAIDNDSIPATNIKEVVTSHNAEPSTKRAPVNTKNAESTKHNFLIKSNSVQNDKTKEDSQVRSPKSEVTTITGETTVCSSEKTITPKMLNNTYTDKSWETFVTEGEDPQRMTIELNKVHGNITDKLDTDIPDGLTETKREVDAISHKDTVLAVTDEPADNGQDVALPAKMEDNSSMPGKALRYLIGGVVVMAVVMVSATKTRSCPTRKHF